MTICSVCKCDINDGYDHLCLSPILMTDTIKRFIDDGDELQRLISKVNECVIGEMHVNFRLNDGRYIEITASNERGEIFVELIEIRK